MRFKRLDLNLLVALDILLAECNITRAARRLNLSQSATSGVLSRLRAYFEDELLVQVGRSMVLTPLACRLAEPVRDVLLQIQATIETKSAFVPATSSRNFQVITTDYPTSVLLAEVMQVVSREAPGVTLEIKAPDAHAEQLNRGEIDILLMPEKYLLDAHPKEILFEDTYSCVIWNKNRVIGDTLSLEQYMSLGHVSTCFGESDLPSFEEWFLHNTGMHRRIEVTTSNFNTLPQFVIGTNRIATMHTRLARRLANYFPLRLLPPPISIPLLVECMQWHKYLDNDPSHIWFRDVLKRVAQGSYNLVEN